MNRQITLNNLEDNAFFWYTYIKWFNGYDDINEINIDEALEVIGIDKEKLAEWEEQFFSIDKSGESLKFIGGNLVEDITFLIEFQDHEIVFFLNDIYFGNLGGHFEAWFLTWDELLSFQQFEHLFLLMLPMTAIEQHQRDNAKQIIHDHLKTIPKFEQNAEYISSCILNGLLIDELFFEIDEVGTVNNQNHSVRNIRKYPRYRENVIELNKVLKKL
ncbi:Imm19 family immunity protein [Sphingobacterium sp. Lzh-3]|uniref:Imm19 family immunity protein n=1 Tax=Sphingobacterium TaxID=28453 RepID=UPI0029549A40|nr:Imm19 family immunity protein [Sphingobacterium sp. UGAL515B_05]WON92496.1 Imm19 family immunity protein [Sphingobacterium sp. UGAL515B_05]